MQRQRFKFDKKRGRRASATKRVLAGALSVALTVCMATVTGCRDSDALKDIIYDQSSSLIDYNNPNKFYINDSTSQEESDKVSSMEVSDEDPDTDQVQNLVVYSSDPNTVGFTAKKSEFSSTPDFHGIQASESVFFYLSDSIDAFDHAVTPSPEDEEPQPEEEEQPDPDEGTASGDSSATGTGAGGSVSGGTSTDPTPSENGASRRGKDAIEEEDDSGKTSSDGVGGDKEFSVAFDISDPDADTPSVDCFAAYGQYAVIVQMIGGSGALAATDATTLSELNSAGVSNTAVAGWSGSGSPSPSDIDVDAIIASGAKYIITTDAAEYTRQLNTYSMDKLNNAGVQFVTLRSMNTSENIKANVETIGEMLQGSTKATNGSIANERASHYKEVHDSVVSQANGGLAKDSINPDMYGNPKVLQYQGVGAIGFSSNSPTYTVLIDDYDPDAVHTGLGFSSGLAYASAGWATTPVSYYIQAGGSINNAATLTTCDSSGKIPVLQFAQKVLSPTSSSWVYGKTVSLLNEKAMANLARPVLDSGLPETNALGMSAGLGTSYMPSVIVTTKKIKQEILDNSEETYGMYHPYGYVTNGTIGSAGAQVSGSDMPIWSCIGANENGPTASSPQNPLGDSLSEDNVKVMPTGKFCDWTEGTVESFLLSGWVSAEINDSGYDWFSQVSDFYDYFYGISITESSMFK